MPIRWLTIFLDLPSDSCDTGVAFWTAVTGSTLSPWRGAACEFATLVPAHGDPYLRVQRVQDGVGGCHLDLHVDHGSESLDEAAMRVTRLGARILRREDDLIIIESPGGFTACLVRWDGESTVPDPVQPDGGPASRLDQLCLDIPPATFEPECSFWQALTGWEARAGALDGFSYLVRPTGIPIRLLFQRRAVARDGDRVTAHIDFACADAASLARAHTMPGARVLAPYPHWVTMADPTGRPYCLTARDPMTGMLPPSHE